MASVDMGNPFKSTEDWKVSDYKDSKSSFGKTVKRLLILTNVGLVRLFSSQPAASAASKPLHEVKFQPLKETVLEIPSFGVFGSDNRTARSFAPQDEMMA